MLLCEALRSTSFDFFLRFRPILFHRHKGHYCRFRRKRQGRTANNAKWAKKIRTSAYKKARGEQRLGIGEIRFTSHERRDTSHEIRIHALEPALN